MHTTIRAERKRQGLSQYKLGQLAKISRFKLSLFECGYADLTAEELDRLNKTLFDQKSKVHGT